MILFADRELAEVAEVDRDARGGGETRARGLGDRRRGS
jgi:hypothetical protein